MVNIIFVADSQRVYSQPVRTREELEIITDSDIKVLVKTQDIKIENSI